jgi:hypothetical protein
MTMQSRLSAFLAALLFAVFAAPAPYLPATAAAAAALQGPAAPPAPSAGSAKTWESRHQEFEDFIRTAEIDHFEDIPIGVTKPKRAYFKSGGLVDSVAWKVLPPGRPSGYWESYKSEIAGYELDKLLQMNMVPPTVEKKWKYDTAAAIMWLKPVRPWKEVEKLPKPPTWERQVVRMKMFDNLICNKDRNMGNLLVDDEWNLFLIDHSRAFISDKDLPFKMARIDRVLWDRMLALDEASLGAALSKWVDRGEIRAMLARRDKMKIEVDKLVKATSEPAVFIR